MVFSNECRGNSAGSCVVTAVGVIDADAPARFMGFMDEGIEGNRVLLDSPGGDLSAGIALGRAIRDFSMETEVGRWQSDGIFGEIAPGASCASACAYAFLGGTLRKVPEGNQLGFHQFYVDPSQVPQQVSGNTLVKAMQETQRLSGEIVSYLIEMGIDARIFGLGSQAGAAGMIYPDQSTMLDYDLVTLDGFAPFFMEPYGSGVIAASRRLGPTRLYDEMTQLTALCRAGRPALLINANGFLDHVDGGEILLDASTEIRLSDRKMTPRGDNAVEIQLSEADGTAISAARKMEVRIGRGQADGGDILGSFTLGGMDRSMLGAAFRFCI